VEPASVQEVEVTIASEMEISNPSSDPFMLTADEFLALKGLSGGFRRRKVNKADTVKSKAVEVGYTFAYDNFGVVVPDYNPTYLAKVYEKSAPHYAAVQSKVANIVDLGYDLEPTYKLKSDIERATSDKTRKRLEQKAEDEKNAVLEWLDSLNWLQPFSDTLHAVAVDLESTGNAYIEIGRTKSGKINYVGHIPSVTMRVRRDRDGFVQLVGTRVIYFRNFGDTTTENPLTDDRNPNEVIHVKNYTPTNSFYGIPDIIPATEALAGDEFASRYNLDYFEHKAVPRYVIYLKGASISEANQRKILELFQTGVKGKHHRSVFLPLPPDSDGNKVEFKMEAIEAKAQDSSFNTYRKMNIDEIFMAHRTPKTKSGYMDGVGLAAARDADKGFKEQVTRPRQDMLEKRINLIIKTVTDNFKFQLTEMTLSDEDTQSKIDERYLRMQTMVPNEVRKRYGLPPLDGGDEPVKMGAQAAAEQNAQARQSRTRDANRSAGSSDSSGEGRNAQGDGRTTE
jgi:PBSX family phage portal protein